MASTYIPRNTHQKGTYQIWHFHILNATAQATRTITHCQRYNVRKTFTLWTVRKKNYTINWLDLLVQRFIFICLLLHRRWSKWYVCELRKNKTIKAPTFRDLVNSESALHRCRMCVDFIVDIFTTASTACSHTNCIHICHLCAADSLLETMLLSTLYLYIGTFLRWMCIVCSVIDLICANISNFNTNLCQ